MVVLESLRVGGLPAFEPALGQCDLVGPHRARIAMIEGNSGVGKSTLLQMIQWAFSGVRTSVGDAHSGPDFLPCQVEVRFEDGDNHFCLIRQVRSADSVESVATAESLGLTTLDEAGRWRIVRGHELDDVLAAARRGIVGPWTAGEFRSGEPTTAFVQRIESLFPGLGQQCLDRLHSVQGCRLLEESLQCIGRMHRSIRLDGIRGLVCRPGDVSDGEWGLPSVGEWWLIELAMLRVVSVDGSSPLEKNLLLDEPLGCLAEPSRHALVSALGSLARQVIMTIATQDWDPMFSSGSLCGVQHISLSRRGCTPE